MVLWRNREKKKAPLPVVFRKNKRPWPLGLSWCVLFFGFKCFHQFFARTAGVGGGCGGGTFHHHQQDFMIIPTAIDASTGIIFEMYIGDVYENTNSPSLQRTQSLLLNGLHNKH